MPKKRPEEEDGVVTQSETKPQVEPPRMFKVLLHNDNYTTMDFVVFILTNIFHKSEEDAVQIMVNVHRKGIGLAGLYQYDIAETKMQTVLQMAKEAEFPLQCSMEPE